MTREGLDTIIDSLRSSYSSEDNLVADHIEDVLEDNDAESWEEVQEYVKSSVEEIRSAAQFVLEQLEKEKISCHAITND